MSSTIIPDSFFITALLLKFEDDTVVMLYNDGASVVPSACRLSIEDSDPSVRLTTGVVCPASVQKKVIYHWFIN